MQLPCNVIESKVIEQIVVVVVVVVVRVIIEKVTIGDALPLEAARRAICDRLYCMIYNVPKRTKFQQDWAI